MEFAFDHELLMLRDSVRRFVQEELMPLEARYANEPDIPDELRKTLQDKAKALGFWCFDLPEEHGGGGVGYVGMCLVMEELAKCNAPSFRAQTVLTPYLGPVLFRCSPEQKKKYLYPVINGEKRTCFALTEPGAGSDPSGMLTTALREGDHYRINGSKIYITSADKADFVQLFVKTGDTGSGNHICLVRSDHPSIKKGLSLTQFCSASHVVIEPPGSRLSGHAIQTSTTSMLERHLSALGITRRVVLRVPHFTVVPAIVQQTDLITTLPSYVLSYIRNLPNLKTFKLPFDVPSYDIKQFWHERKHKDPANRWLRTLVSELFTKN